MCTLLSETPQIFALTARRDKDNGEVSHVFKLRSFT
jgi:hypothetical protein